MILDQYLDSAAARLRALSVFRVIAAVAAVAAALIVGGTGYLVSAVPAGHEVLLLRIAALVALLIAGMVLIRLLAGADVVSELERRIPAFAGRLETWRDAQRHHNTANILALLEREVVDVAADRPPERLLGWRDWAWPAAVILLAGFALVALLSPLSGNWSHAAQRLLLGEGLSAGAPRINLTPGSVTIPLGFDVIVEAQSVGFDPRDMRIHARFEESSLWQDTAMSRLGDDLYGFVFVAVGDRVDYYVSSGSVTSDRYSIRVAALPRLVSLKVSADYPDWSGLPDSVSRDGDIAALAGTHIQLEVTLDEPDTAAYLVVDDEAQALNLTAAGLSAGFAVTADGAWHIAVEHDGELARISDQFQIRLLDDAAPEITYVWPGRDLQATAIEEVVLEFAATDDFAVERLAVNVAVNGGDWQVHILNAESGSHLLELESLSTSAGRSLAPGDVISLYAQADDHSQTTRSDLYFIDVRPFDRRYRESQQSGGNQGGAGDQLDIAQRQKEVLSATWNLLNKPENTEQAAVAREAEVVAMLQRKLAEQVQVLIERASARSLDQDQSVAQFVESLNLAMAEMPAAAEFLERVQLDEAVVPEQRALAHLRAAEATVRDMDVAMSDSRGRGTMSDSLSELVDLEMDRERNRYETPQQLNPEGESPEADPSWERLAELAERQQQLARERARNAQDPASRWQQEQLQREVEQLREQLEGRRQRSQRSGGTASQSLSEAIEALDQVDQSLEQDRVDEQSSQQISDALQRAAQSLRENQVRDAGARLERARQTAQSLAETQDAVMERLHQAQERSLSEDNSGEFNPWQDFSMSGDVATKSSMREELGELRAQLAAAVSEFSEDPRVSDQLVNAQRMLDDQRIDERLAAAADAFEMGRPLYALAHEETVQRGLDELTESLEAAQQIFSEGSSAQSGRGSQRAVASLRQSLSSARQGEEVDAAAVASVAAQAEALARQLAQPDSSGSGMDARLQADRASYTSRGLNSDDPEQLYRMTEAALDLLEVALDESSQSAVQAQEQRSPQRDSSAVAEYFRRLSDEAKAPQ